MVDKPSFLKFKAFRLLNFVLILIFSCGIPPKERAIQILKKYSTDKSAIIRVNAAKGLAEIGDAQGITLLYEIIGGNDKDAIVAALGALYDLKEQTCSPPLILLTKNSDPLIRAEVLKVIAGIEDKACQELLIKGTADRIAKIRRICYAGLEKFKAKKTIHQGLRDADPLVRIVCAKTLGLLGEKGMENFIRNELKTINQEIWSQAIIALAEISDTSAVAFIKGLLTDTPWDLRIAAAEALLILKNSEGVDILKQGLQASDPFTRVKCVEVLRKFPVLALYELLKLSAEDEYINVSIGAIQALKNYRKKESKPLFEKLMNAPNPMVKIAAATAYLTSQ